MKLKIFIIILLFILTLNCVNASAEINPNQTESDINNTSALGNTYIIDENNYHTYFNTENGKLNENSTIKNGDEIKFGNLTDKVICIDKMLKISSLNPNSQLTNSMIKLTLGSDNSVIKDINMASNQNTRFTNVLELNNVNNITILNSLFNSTHPVKYNILINSSNSTTVYNSTFIKLKYTDTVNIYSTKDSANLSVNNCIFKDEPAPDIISNDLTKIERNASQFEAKFLAKLTPLSDTEITFKLNNVEYKRQTDSDGIAKLTINLSPGNYTIQSINPNGGIKNNIITVIPRIIENNDLEKYYHNDSQYLIKILDDEGNPAKSNETVTFNINGVFYNRTTNDSGYAKLNINLQPGRYIITAEYKNCKSSNHILVKPILYADDLTKKYNSFEAFEVKLLDGKGDELSNAIITFNINGVFYNRTTDNNGIARLNINLMQGKYIITSSYDSSNLANKITVIN